MIAFISVRPVPIASHAYLTGDGMDNPGEIVVFDLAVLHPRRKPPQLTVVAVVRHPHLRANEEYLAIMDNNTAVVDDVLVYHRPNEILINTFLGPKWESTLTSLYRKRCPLPLRT